MLPGLSELGKRYPHLAGDCQFAGIKLRAEAFQLDAAAAPWTQLRLSARALFRSVGTTPGCARAPSHAPPSRARHLQHSRALANLPSTGPAQHESPAYKILPLASQCPRCSLFFLLLFSFFSLAQYHPPPSNPQETGHSLATQGLT